MHTYSQIRATQAGPVCIRSGFGQACKHWSIDLKPGLETHRERQLFHWTSDHNVDKILVTLKRTGYFSDIFNRVVQRGYVTDWLQLTQTMPLVVYQPKFMNVAFNFNGRV